MQEKKKAKQMQSDLMKTKQEDGLEYNFSGLTFCFIYSAKYLQAFIKVEHFVRFWYVCLFVTLCIYVLLKWGIVHSET